MQYKVLAEFEVPGLPLFKEGQECDVEPETAKVLVSRGLIQEMVERPRKTPEQPKK